MGDFESFACVLADASRGAIQPRLRDAGIAEDKSGGGAFDPVTEADRAAERVMRAMIEQRYPAHGIIGEEYPDRLARSAYTWSLDPIDGTRSFVCGLPTWVTLIGLLKDGAPTIGVIDAPRLDERYVGGPEGSRVIDSSGASAVRTSGCESLSGARLSTTDPYLFTPVEAAAFERLRRDARLVRYGHDGYGYARLAAGSLDLVVESGLKPHDYNALVPVVRGAGGMIGDWRGGSDFAPGQVIAAATSALFEEAVAVLKEAALS